MKRNEIRVDAATNLAAFASSSGEVVARCEIKLDDEGWPTLFVESSIGVEVDADVVAVVHRGED